MDGPERRSHRRATVALPSEVFIDDRLCLRARTLDLSPSGALLHGAAALDVGQQVRLELDRGGVRNPLSLQAEVVRIEVPAPGLRRHGIALRFLHCGAADVAALRSLIGDRDELTES
jgi:hypothetical protein